MKVTVGATLNKTTVLGQKLVDGCYTKEDLNQTVTIISSFSKDEAERVLRQKDATAMELILCKALVKAFAKGGEQEFKIGMLKRFYCGTTVEKSKII